MRIPFTHHHVHFSAIDPLGGGLRELIQREQSEMEAITLDNYIDPDELIHRWDEVYSDIQKDPTHFSDVE